MDYEIDCHGIFVDFVRHRRWETGANVSGLTNDGQYERNYLTVYHLMTHSKDIPPQDLFQYSLVRIEFKRNI